MTYVELITVLGIFSVLLGVAMYNHNKFQDKVSIKNLANDIALQIVEAQKSALSGKLQTTPFTPKPSYGVYFNPNAPGNNRSFIYFADFNNDGTYNDTVSPFCGTISGECLKKITLNRGNIISNLEYYYALTGPNPLANLTVTFMRPSSEASLRSTTPPTPGYTISHAQITVTSASGITANIKVYPTGRIQIN